MLVCTEIRRRPGPAKISRRATVFLYLIGRLFDAWRAPRCFSSRWVNLGSPSRFHLPLRNSLPRRETSGIDGCPMLSLSPFSSWSRWIRKKTNVSLFSIGYQRRVPRQVSRANIVISSFTFSRYSRRRSLARYESGVRVQAEPVTTDAAPLDRSFQKRIRNLG